MSGLLNRAAVSALDPQESAEILQEYMNTQPQMVLSVHPAAAQQPQGTGAGDHLIKPF